MLSQCDEAIQLVHDAIVAGILGDLGSGSNVDICIITKHTSQLIRPHDSLIGHQYTPPHHR